MTPAHIILKSVADKIQLPSVYYRIKKLIKVPDATIDDFVKVIELDPALSVRVIKMSNSQFFGYGRKVYTVKQAISLIGVLQLHDLLLSSLAIRAFSAIPSDLIDQRAFWRSSVFCGITARLLAKKLMVLASERLFTSGILHEIGHIVMYAQIPEQIQDVIFESQQTNQPVYLIEREKIGFDYGQIGNEIMKLWHLPDNYCEITLYHLEPEKASEHKIDINIVNLARTIMLTEEGNSGVEIDEILNTPNTLINQKLNRKDVEAIKNKAHLYVDEVMDCLWPFSEKKVEDYQIIL